MSPCLPAALRSGRHNNPLMRSGIGYIGQNSLKQIMEDFAEHERRETGADAASDSLSFAGIWIW